MSDSPFWEQLNDDVTVPQAAPTKKSDYNKTLAVLKTASDVSFANEAEDTPVSDLFQSNLLDIDANPDAAKAKAVINYTDNVSDIIAEATVGSQEGFDPASSFAIHDMLVQNVSSEPEIAIEKTGLEALDVPPEEVGDYLVQQKLIEWNKGEGFVENGLDILGSMIPFRELGDIPEAFGSEEDFMELAVGYRNASPEDQQLVINYVADELVKATDNRRLRSSLLSQFLEHANPEHHVKVLGIQGAAELTPVGIGGDLVALGKAVTRSASPMRKAARAGNTQGAGSINAASIANPDIAAGNGTNQTTAWLNATPFKNEEILNDSVDDIQNETVKAIAGKLKLDDEAYRNSVVDSLSEIDDITIASTVGEADRLTAVKAAKYKMERDLAKTLGPNTPKIEDMEVVNMSDDGVFSLKAKIKSADSSGKDYDHVQEFRVYQEDLQAFDVDNMREPGLWANTVFSNQFAMEDTIKGGTINKLVENMELARSTEDIITRKFAQAYKNAAGGLSKRQTKTVNGLLLESTVANNGMGKRYTPQELYAKGVDEDTMAAYYRVNSMNDVVATYRARLRYEERLAAGAKTVDFFDGVYRSGKVSDTLQGARNVLNLWRRRNNDLVGEIEVFNPTTGKMMKEHDALSEIKAGKAQLVQLDEAVQLGGKKGEAELAVVPNNNVMDLQWDADIFKGIDSYSPIIRREAFYAVTENVKKKVNGLTISSKRIHTLSPSLSEAQKVRQEAIDKATAEGTTLDLNEVVRPSDKGAKFIDDSAEGKLYYGKRATHKFNEIAQAAEIVDPVEAIGQNLHQLGKAMSYNKVRMELNNRFKATAAKYEVDGSANPLDYSLTRPISNTSERGRKLEYMRKYIVGQLSVPDKNTQTWSSLNRNLAEWMDGEFGNNWASRTLMKSSNIDPIVTLKSSAFHALLGWFNPSQLFVQATNMAVAMSLHPIMTITQSHKALGLMIGMNRDNPAFARWIGKRVGVDPDEMEDIHKNFINLGLRDSVRSNADIEVSYHGFGHPMAGFKKAADKGLMFYRQGELAGRSVSFMVARQNYLKKHGMNWQDLTPSDYKEIFSDFQAITLNLSSANKSPFQYGVVSLPTQFWHVQTKFIEKLLGRQFTLQERMKMVVGQAALFGAAGVPFGNKLAEWYADSHRDKEGNYNGPVDSDVIKQGMMSYFFGGELALADRAGLGRSVSDFYDKLFEDSQKTSFELLLGASGVLFNRGTVAAKMTQLAVDPYEAGAEQAEIDDVMKAWAKVISTGSNALKGWEMMNYNAVYDSKGRTLYSNPTVTEIYGRMFGFQSQRTKDMYTAMSDNYDREAVYKENVDFIMKYWLDVEGTMDFENPATWDRLLVTAQSRLATMNEYDREQVLKKLFNRINKEKPREEYTYQQSLKKSWSAETNALVSQDAQNLLMGGQ